MCFGKLFFFTGLFATWLRPFITNIPVLTFSPYIVYHLTHSSLKSLLWRAVLVGSLFDCFNSFLPFGFHIAIYPLCCSLLYRKRALLIGDKPFSLPLYTFVFAVVFSLAEHLYLCWTKTRIHINYTSLCTEFLLMPLFDGAYAFVCFTLPSWIIGKFKDLRLKN